MSWKGDKLIGTNHLSSAVATSDRKPTQIVNSLFYLPRRCVFALWFANTQYGFVSWVYHNPAERALFLITLPTTLATGPSAPVMVFEIMAVGYSLSTHDAVQ